MSKVEKNGAASGALATKTKAAPPARKPSRAASKPGVPDQHGWEMSWTRAGTPIKVRLRWLAADLVPLGSRSPHHRSSMIWVGNGSHVILVNVIWPDAGWCPFIWVATQPMSSPPAEGKLPACQRWHVRVENTKNRDHPLNLEVALYRNQLHDAIVWDGLHQWLFVDLGTHTVACRTM
jgi:hypothetical protein